MPQILRVYVPPVMESNSRDQSRFVCNPVVHTINAYNSPLVPLKPPVVPKATITAQMVVRHVLVAYKVSAEAVGTDAAGTVVDLDAVAIHVFGVFLEHVHIFHKVFPSFMLIPVYG